jgi:hypothetical protein
VVNARDIAYVLDVIGDGAHVARRARIGPKPPRLSSEPLRAVLGEVLCDVFTLDEQLVPPAPALLGEEARHEGDHHNSAAVAYSAQHVVGHVTWMIAQGPSAGVGEKGRRGGHVKRRSHRRRRDMRQVDQHPKPVALPDDLTPERRQPAHDGAIGGAVGPRGVLVMSQREVAHAERVHHP